jgi:tRNA nucleotidyltransferase (CCA-adding enzyme)
MAKAGAMYPQVEPSAALLMHRRVATCSTRLSVADALAEAERAGADVLVLGTRDAVRQGELRRAADWGLGACRATAVAWHGLPTISARATEIEVRRLVLAGAPMLLVTEGERMVGVIESDRMEIIRPALSLAHRLDRVDAFGAEAALSICRVAGKLGEELGMPVYAVAGFVRDLLLERRPMDLDLLVEGDGVLLARRLVEEVGGRLVIHHAFGTASIERDADRIDVASARRERYEAPGALPVVSAASMDDDLRRRDFTVNAMAIAVWPSAFGRLHDPLGGQADLGRRRLRPLSPLSFVEDPTRIFRGARYAARLGFTLDRSAMRALHLALSLREYPALSGQRLRAEIEWLTGEPSGWRALELLLRRGAFTLWDPAYRSTSRSRSRVKAAARLCAWARDEGIALDATEVALIALLVDQPERVATRCLTRLAITGAPFDTMRAAAHAAPLARRLERGGTARPSAAVKALESVAMPMVISAWLRGGRRARRRIAWFLGRAKATRPRLSGDDVIALGVRRGPDVGECLSALRRRRLDGAVRTVADEREFVMNWLRRSRRSTSVDAGRREQRRHV